MYCPITKEELFEVMPNYLADAVEDAPRRPDHRLSKDRRRPELARHWSRGLDRGAWIPSAAHRGRPRVGRAADPAGRARRALGPLDCRPARVAGSGPRLHYLHQGAAVHCVMSVGRHTIAARLRKLSRLLDMV